MHMIRATFRYEYEDVRQMAHFHRSRVRGRLGCFLGITTVLSLATFIWGETKYKASTAPWYHNANVALLLLIMVFAALRQLYASAVRSNWLYAGPLTTAEIDADRITFRTTRRDSALRWSEIVDMRDTECGYHLITGDGIVWMIPRRALSPSDAIAFKGLVSRWSNLRAAGSRTCSDTQIACPPTASVPSPTVKQMNEWQQKAMWYIAGSAGLLLGGLALSTSSDPSLKRPETVVLTVIVVAGTIVLYTVGCMYVALSRGFRARHGFAGLVFPFGLILLATRARPVAGEAVDRLLWASLFRTPNASNEEIMRGE